MYILLLLSVLDILDYHIHSEGKSKYTLKTFSHIFFQTKHINTFNFRILVPAYYQYLLLTTTRKPIERTLPGVLFIKSKFEQFIGQICDI